MKYLLNNKFIFSWTPKAGCTTVTKLVFGAMGILDEANAYGEWVHTYRSEVFSIKYRDWVATEKQLLDDNYKKMKIVRNPYLRAVSSYLSANKKAVEHGYKVDGKYIDTSFFEFLNLYKNKKLVDMHWTPQYEEIESKFVYDEIIHIENLDNRIKEINKKYGLKLKIDSDSGHHRTQTAARQFVGDMKYSKLMENNDNTFPSYETFYDEKIKELVYDLYRVDFGAYSYDKEFPT